MKSTGASPRSSSWLRHRCILCLPPCNPNKYFTSNLLRWEHMYFYYTCCLLDASLNAGDTNVPAVPTTAPAAGISESPNPVAPKSKPLKNIVQEYCQQNGLKLPVYNTVKDSGMFIATVNVNGVDYVGTPHIMKKTAENNSAKKVCESLGLK